MNTAQYCDLLAARLPGKAALFEREGALTWGEISRRSIRLAAGLVGLGLPRGAAVYVQLPNCAELFLLRLACERAGLRLVTVPPAFRHAELTPILEATRPGVAVVPGRFRGLDYVGLLTSLPAARTIQRVYTVSRWDRTGAPTLDTLLESGDPSAEILSSLGRRGFADTESSQLGTTSGSTGVVKLVEVTIGARQQTGKVQAQRYGVREDDRILALTPLITGTVDALGYHGSPQVGCGLILTEQFDADLACRLIVGCGATVVIGVPTMIARMLACRELDAVPGGLVRVFVSHGSVLPPRVGEELETRLGCRVLQAYGTFDYGGVCATSYDDPTAVRLETVGRPLDGNELVVLDARGQPVAPGQAGRLYVRGAHANAGYFGDAELTRAAWANGYFDLMEFGRQDALGNIVLLGRAREIIIRGGQNISPREIEGMLAGHPGVAEVAVVGLPDPILGEIACACIVRRRGSEAGAEDLLRFLRESGIAAFKFPERFEFFDSLPVLAVGHKVDRRRLSPLVLARSPGEAPAAGARARAPDAAMPGILTAHDRRDEP